MNNFSRRQFSVFHVRCVLRCYVNILLRLSISLLINILLFRSANKKSNKVSDAANTLPHRNKFSKLRSFVRHSHSDTHLSGMSLLLWFSCVRSSTCSSLINFHVLFFCGGLIFPEFSIKNCHFWSIITFRFSIATQHTVLYDFR